MRRRVFLMSVSGALAGCMKDGVRRLNVFNWDNYVARETIPEFEKRFHCHVRYGVYASAEELLAKVMTGNSGWDVVFPSNTFVEHLRALKLLVRLETSRLPNLGNIDAVFRAPEWDPKLEWCVPYMHGGTGIVYSRKLAPHLPSAWADLWSDAAARRITMMDDPAEVFAASLKRLKASVNAADRASLQAARKLAMQQKPLLRAYLNEEVRDQVIAGDVLAAQMWTQVGQMSMDSSRELGFAFPAEGFPLYVDCACILRESRHVELAYEFLNYLLEPRVAAQIAIEVTCATVNCESRKLLPTRLQESPVLYPDAETRGRGELFRALPADAQRLRDRYWTEIKSA